MVPCRTVEVPLAWAPPVPTWGAAGASAPVVPAACEARGSARATLASASAGRIVIRLMLKLLIPEYLPVTTALVCACGAFAVGCCDCPWLAGHARAASSVITRLTSVGCGRAQIHSRSSWGVAWRSIHTRREDPSAARWLEDGAVQPRNADVDKADMIDEDYSSTISEPRYINAFRAHHRRLDSPPAARSRAGRGSARRRRVGVHAGVG